jgi:hypothetical protein
VSLQTRTDTLDAPRRRPPPRAPPPPPPPPSGQPGRPTTQPRTARAWRSRPDGAPSRRRKHHPARDRPGRSDSRRTAPRPVRLT